MKFTDLGDTGAQLDIKVEAAPAGVKLAAGAAMGALSGAGGHILGAVFGPIGSIAMAAAMAHQGATLGMKMADGIWDFFSDKLGGDNNAEEFAMAHLTAASKGMPTFDYRGKTYNVKVPQQQARAAAVEVRKVTESLTERRQQGLIEFAPAGSGDGGDDGFDERMLKQFAAQWWNGDEDPKAEKTLLAAGWEIGQDEGYDNGGVFVVQAGDEHGKSYISWPAEELEQGMTEASIDDDTFGLDPADDIMSDSGTDDNAYGYRVGQTVKLPTGGQGRVIDIFDDAIEVQLTNGQSITVDFRDAEVIGEASLAQMRDFFNQPDDSIAVNRGAATSGRNPAGIPPEIQTLVNKMYHSGKISPAELQILRDFQRKTKINVGIREADKNPYAIGMAQAMKSTGDKPPLKKSTINKAHEIARAVKKGE